MRVNELSSSPTASSAGARYLTAALNISLLLLALSVPVSIAATQTAWAFALLFWLIRAIFVRRRFEATGFSLALIAFVGLTVVSSIFSYEPAVSLKKLVAVSLVTIVYLVSQVARDVKSVRRLVTIVLISGVAAASYAAGIFAIGKKLKVTRLAAESPLRAAGVLENDTILAANGVSVASPAQLAAAVKNDSQADLAKLKVYRFEVIYDFDMPTMAFEGAGNGEEKLGIEQWSRGRDVRAGGFFGHYTTYAESVQLLLSIAFGSLIVVPGGLFARKRILLAMVAVLFSFALFLTVTRASWAGFLISASIMILIGTSRKVVIVCLLAAIPLAAAGLIYLQQKRNVGFIDTKDYSTTWRITVWGEAAGILFSSPKNMIAGVGMDSIKSRWAEWHMFDNGNLPLGHLHSTPLQLAFERGVPALIAWIAWMFFYLRILYRTLRKNSLEWPERGFIVGAFGGTFGFLACGLVHYNWGDSEVVMLFYLLMGLSISIASFGQNRNESPSIT